MNEHSGHSGHIWYGIYATTTMNGHDGHIYTQHILNRKRYALQKQHALTKTNLEKKTMRSTKKIRCKAMGKQNKNLSVKESSHHYSPPDKGEESNCSPPSSTTTKDMINVRYEGQIRQDTNSTVKDSASKATNGKDNGKDIIDTQDIEGLPVNIWLKRAFCSSGPYCAKIPSS